MSNRKSTTTRPKIPLDTFADERLFHDHVMGRLGEDSRRWTESATPPEVHEWVVIVSAIKGYQRRPWTDDDSSELTKGIRRQKEERATLDVTAEILEQDYKRLFGDDKDNPELLAWMEQHQPQRLQRYRDAIALLRQPRGAADSKADPARQVSEKGPSWTGWSFVVREIAPAIYRVLAGHGITVATGEKAERAPLTLVMRDVLQFIYGTDNLPTPRQLAKKISEVIDGT